MHFGHFRQDSFQVPSTCLHLPLLCSRSGSSLRTRRQRRQGHPPRSQQSLWVKDFSPRPRLLPGATCGTSEKNPIRVWRLFFLVFSHTWVAAAYPKCPKLPKLPDCSRCKCPYDIQMVKPTPFLSLKCPKLNDLIPTSPTYPFISPSGTCPSPTQEVLSAPPQRATPVPWHQWISRLLGDVLVPLKDGVLANLQTSFVNERQGWSWIHPNIHLPSFGSECGFLDVSLFHIP